MARRSRFLVGRGSVRARGGALSPAQTELRPTPTRNDALSPAQAELRPTRAPHLTLPLRSSPPRPSGLLGVRESGRSISGYLENNSTHRTDYPPPRRGSDLPGCR